MMTDQTVKIDFSSSDFVAAPSFGLLTTGIMPLVHIKDEVARAVGTCFAISNDGLCLTARHVIEEALPGPVRDGRLNTEADGWLHALYASGEPNAGNPKQLVGGLLPIHRIYFNNDLDIAAVQLLLPQNTETNELLKMPACKLSLGLPKRGSVCIAFGYHKMEWKVGDETYNIAQEFSSSRGLVEDVHLPRRDAIMAPFPCFRVSARYDAGMSGGPVVGANGLVYGVVCSSLQGLNSEDGHISYASIVGPAALVTVERANETGIVSKCFIGDLIARRIVAADNDGASLERLDSELRLHVGGGVVRNTIDATPMIES